MLDTVCWNERGQATRSGKAVVAIWTMRCLATLLSRLAMNYREIFLPICIEPRVVMALAYVAEHYQQHHCDDVAA